MSAETVPQGPLVSVVVAAYNAASTIAATLASIRAQTYYAIEILVVDDGSTDATPHIVEKVASDEPRLHLFRQSNGGVARARNAAIAAAKGEWIALIDADDIWHPEKLARQIRVALTSELAPALVYSWCRRIDTLDRVIADQGRPMHSGMQFDQLLAFNFMNNASNAIFRADAFRTVGGFDETYQKSGAFGAEDITLYLALAERWPITPAPGFLVGYRTVGSGMSAAPERMRMSVEIMLHKLEQRVTDASPAVFKLSRTFYDIYAASLALRSGKKWLFASFLARAAKRRLVITSVFIVCAMIWRRSERRFVERDRSSFYSLAPDRQSFRQPLMEWFDAYRTRCVERAARQ